MNPQLVWAFAILSVFLLINLLVKIGMFYKVRGPHGAEHMLTHALAAGAEMTPDAIRQFPRFHQACGTSSVAFMIIPFIPTFLLTRSTLASLIVGIEFDSMFGYRDNWFLRALQAITTAPPNEETLVAAALLGKTIREREP